jgi:hypothetical protein
MAWVAQELKEIQLLRELMAQQIRAMEVAEVDIHHLVLVPVAPADLVLLLLPFTCSLNVHTLLAIRSILRMIIIDNRERHLIPLLPSTIQIQTLPVGDIWFQDVSGTHAESTFPVIFEVTQGPTPTPKPTPSPTATKKPTTDGCRGQIKN